MRCPDCQKFVSYDTEVEPEEDSSVEFVNGTVTGQFRRPLNCAECGTELKSADIEVTADIEVSERCKKSDDGEHEWEMDADSSEPTERMQTTDRHGKPIKSSRYMRHYYGVSVSGQIKCEHCGEAHSFTATGEEMASAFDEQV